MSLHYFIENSELNQGNFYQGSRPSAFTLKMTRCLSLDTQ